MKFILSLCLVLFCWSATLQADDELATRVQLELVDQSILPALEQFESASSTLSSDAAAFCETSDAVLFDNLRQSFQNTVDGWQSIQWLRKGPAEFATRHQRIALWPDKHDTVARQLRRLLQKADTDDIDAQQFATGSVAIQGIPALERLLYDDKPLTAFTESDNAGFRCQYLLAIAANLQHISAKLSADWNPMYRQAISAPDGGNAFFESDRGVTSQIMSQLITELQFMFEQKMLRPLGIESAATAITVAAFDPRPRRAENWRSQRALRNLKLNLAAIRDAWSIALAPLIPSAEQKTAINDAFQTASDTLDALPDSFGQALENEPEALADAATALNRLRERAEHDLPDALDIPLGFNGLDGD